MHKDLGTRKCHVRAKWKSYRREGAQDTYLLQQHRGKKTNKKEQHKKKQPWPVNSEL